MKFLLTSSYNFVKIQKKIILLNPFKKHINYIFKTLFVLKYYLYFIKCFESSKNSEERLNVIFDLILDPGRIGHGNALSRILRRV